jgi:hypothetical protein
MLEHACVGADPKHKRANSNFQNNIETRVVKVCEVFVFRAIDSVGNWNKWIHR